MLFLGWSATLDSRSSEHGQGIKCGFIYHENHRILSIVKWLMTYSWFINVSLLVPMYSWCLIYNWLVLWNMNFIFPYTVLGMS